MFFNDLTNHLWFVYLILNIVKDWLGDRSWAIIFFPLEIKTSGMKVINTLFDYFAVNSQADCSIKVTEHGNFMVAIFW